METLRVGVGGAFALAKACALRLRGTQGARIAAHHLTFSYLQPQRLETAVLSFFYSGGTPE